MTNETLQVIKRRRSIRAFLPDQPPDEALAAIVEAGQYAPSGGGQAWHFSLVQNAQLLERINTLAKRAACASPAPWLRQLGQDEQFHSLYHAPAVVLVSAPADSPVAVQDACAATQTMLLAAESLEVGSCWGYFATQAFDTPEGDELRSALQIPEGYRVYTSVMLGYRAGEAPQPEPRKDCVSYAR